MIIIMIIIIIIIRRRMEKSLKLKHSTTFEKQKQKTTKKNYTINA